MGEWFDSLPEHEQNEWAVNATLRAKRWLADQRDGYDPAERNRKMLAAVEPKAQVCCRCRRAGVRMVAITGDWFCEAHDPLARTYVAARCCGRREVELCSEQQGGWACTAGAAGHRWPHRFRRLGG